MDSSKSTVNFAMVSIPPRWENVADEDGRVPGWSWVADICTYDEGSANEPIWVVASPRLSPPVLAAEWLQALALIGPLWHDIARAVYVDATNYGTMHVDFALRPADVAAFCAQYMPAEEATRAMSVAARYYDAAVAAEASRILGLGRPLPPAERFGGKGDEHISDMQADAVTAAVLAARPGDATRVIPALWRLADYSGPLSMWRWSCSVDLIRDALTRCGAYTPITETRRVTWEDRPGHRNQANPALTVHVPGRTSLFHDDRVAAHDVIGLVHVAHEVGHRNGKWSYSDYALDVPPHAQVWTIDREGTIGLIEDPPELRHRFAEWVDWRDVPERIPVDVVRAMMPGTTKRLDAAGRC